MSTSMSDTSRFVQFSINSNFTSGVVALLLDILLITFIKFQAQLLCSTANVYLVYDKRRAIFPTKSSLSSLAGGPVGPLQLARFSSVLIAVVTACVILLGFSINGKTVDIYEPNGYRSLVHINTSRPADIDYDREFERRNSGIFISKRLAATSDSYACQRNNYNETEIYAHVYKDTHINGEKVGRLTKLPGAECVKTPLFNRSMVVRQYQIGPQVQPARCSVDWIQPRFSDNEKIGTAEYTINECDHDLERFYCFRDERTACAAVGKRTENGHLTTYMHLIPNITQTSDYQTVQIDGGYTPPQEAKLALNVAFLSTMGFTGGVSNLANVAVTHVSYNQTLLRRTNRGQQVSEVDMRLAVPLLAVVGTITLVVTISSVWFWMAVVYLKGRSEYNKFCTVSDLLQLASDGAEGAAGRFRKEPKSHPYIGISRTNPNVVVVGQDEGASCSDSTWAEREIGEYLSVHMKDLLHIEDTRRTGNVDC